MEYYDHSPVDYHYSYTDGVSYPHRYNAFSDHQARYVTGRRRSQSPGAKLYGDGLMQLSRQTDRHIERLKEKMAQIDPCYAFGMKDWRSDGRATLRESCTPELSEEARPKWQDNQIMFGSQSQMNRHMHRTLSAKQMTEKENVGEQSGTTVNKFCYLCTTLEEHQQHIARRGRQLKEKHKPKPRVEYIAPPPLVRKKKEEAEDKEEVLYKITVKTANKPHSDTSANVFIRLRGRKGQTKRRQLKKKLTGNFCFGRGTSETFHIRGPRIGEIRSIIIEHDGVEKKHSWLLDEIEVTNMSSEERLAFPCRAWLSLFVGDCVLKRELRAEVLERQEVEFSITVKTADKRFAGTDANVFITLFGKKGVSRKIPLRNKSKNNFERGQKDTFFSGLMEDIGPITRIKIEHDGSSVGAGWLLEQVIIEDVENPHRRYTFPCGEWLAKDEGDGQLFKMLYPVSGSKRGDSRFRGRGHGGHSDDDEGSMLGPQLDYEVTVVTGNKQYAGTDAHVYLQMYGTSGISQEVELDDEKDNFERNQTDVFKIRAKDVGDLKKVRIRHDNSGLGAGWFLDKMIVRRYFGKDEIQERLSRMQEDFDERVALRASEVTGEDVRPPSRTESLKHSGSVRRKSSREGDSRRTNGRSHDDDDGKYSRRRSSIRRGTVVHLDSSDSDDDDDDGDRRYGRKKKGGRKKKTKLMNYGGHTVYVTDSEQSSDSGSDGDIKKRGKKAKKGKKKRHSLDSSSESSDSDDKQRDKYRRRGSGSNGLQASNQRRRKETRYDNVGRSPSKVWKKGRVPLCDEYLFACARWLAKDEDDEKLERFLKPKSVTTFYKVQK